MIYNAIDVADYIINKCYNDEKPISNLQLQKILYFAWIEYYNKMHKPLFIDNICAWQFGPVVPDVYYEYCVYGGRPINIKCQTDITGTDAELLNKVVDKYVDTPISVLVEMTHKMGGAWDLTYEDGLGSRKVIPFELIKSVDCGGLYVSGRN